MLSVCSWNMKSSLAVFSGPVLKLTLELGHVWLSYAFEAMFLEKCLTIRDAEKLSIFAMVYKVILTKSLIPVMLFFIYVAIRPGISGGRCPGGTDPVQKGTHSSHLPLFTGAMWCLVHDYWCFLNVCWNEWDNALTNKLMRIYFLSRKFNQT